MEEKSLALYVELKVGKTAFSDKQMEEKCLALYVELKVGKTAFSDKL